MRDNSLILCDVLLGATCLLTVWMFDFLPPRNPECVCPGAEVLTTPRGSKTIALELGASSRAQSGATFLSIVLHYVLTRRSRRGRRIVR